MKKKIPSINKYLKFPRNVFTVIGIVAVGFVTWLVMRLITMNVDIAMMPTYVLPAFNSLENLYSLDEGTYGVAINGELVAGKKSREVRPTASMAKMILGLAIMQEKPFEVGDTGEKIAITDEYYDLYQYYVKNGGSVSEVEVGEEISEYDALMSVFLVSSNNMADTLAKWAFGSIEDYQDYATEMLDRWGISATTIGIDASGFDASTTSTASDLTKIATRVMQNPVLREIVGTKIYTVPVAGEIENTNRLLGQSNIAGVKTGFIGEESGYCLASAYTEGENIVATVVMGSPSREESFDNSLAIINTMQDRVPLVKLVSAGETVGYYNSWWTGEVGITANEDLYGLGWADAEAKVELAMQGSTGTLKINLGQQTYEVPVAADDDVASPSIVDRLKHAFGWKNNTRLSSNRD